MKAYGAQMLGQHEDDPVLAGSTADDLHDLIERFLGASWDRISTWRDWEWLKDSISLTWPASASSSSGSALYLPDFVQRIVGFVPSVIGSRPIKIVTASEYDIRRGIGPDDLLVIHGFYGVENDPPSATTLTATSASGAAANGLQVRIEGLTATGNYEQIVTLTLAGAGTATTSATFKGAQGGVRRIFIVPTTVPAAGQGILTVTMGGVTMERLDPSREREHRHIRTELHAGVSSASSFTVRFIRKAFNLTAETDIIPIPEEFTDLLELGIQIEIARLRKAYADAMGMRQEWKERMREFSAFNNRTYNQQRSVTAPRIYSP
jgi:hypothetical protein